LAQLAAVVLSACGGGGGDSAAQTTSASAPPRPVEQSDLQIAQSVTADGSRTPAGFYSDPQPSGYGYVSTMHVKNAKRRATVAAPEPLYELCTDDWNEALAWSELSAQHEPQYSDLVATSDDPRYFEFGRVRQGDPTFYVRARVFKCAYLDRSNANLRDTAGPAGTDESPPADGRGTARPDRVSVAVHAIQQRRYAVLKSSGSSSGTS
jgi:hypothetical protein